MSWFANLGAWSVPIKLFEIDSINGNNNNDNALLQKWQGNINNGLLLGWQVDDDKSDNNEDTVFLLLKRWVWWVKC